MRQPVLRPRDLRSGSSRYRLYKAWLDSTIIDMRFSVSIHVQSTFVNGPERENGFVGSISPTL